MKTKYLIFLILIVYSFSGCRSEHLSPDISDCDTTGVSFSLDVQPILNQHCISCHNDDFSEKEVNLTNYNGVRIPAMDGRLAGVVNHDQGYTPMPYLGDQLPQCDVKIITAWINQGAQNN